jgi:penicillin amidase
MKKFTITLIAGFVVFSAGALLPKSTAQQNAKTISIAGLKDQVTIRRDERGIPYIEATNDDDLYFAQGYVTGERSALADGSFTAQRPRRVG